MVAGRVGESEMALLAITMEDYSAVEKRNDDGGIGGMEEVWVT
jgi:hypothetical protein